MGIANIKQEKKRVPIITLIMMTPKETVWKAEFPRYEGKVPRTFKFTQETRAITGMSRLQFWGSKKTYNPQHVDDFRPRCKGTNRPTRRTTHQGISQYAENRRGC